MQRPLENFKPCLRPGRMLPHGATFTFELEDSREKITLPMLMADFILLCGGQFTIREIVEKIYRKQGAVPFRAILETLYTLHSRGFLENSDQLRERPWLAKQELIRKKMHHDFHLNTAIFASGANSILFYLLSLATLMLSVVCLVFDWQNPIQEAQQALALTPLFFAQIYLFNSLLLTVKYTIRTVQVLSLHGRVTDLSLRVAPWGCYLYLEDPQLDNLEQRILPLLFYCSQIVVPFGILHLGKAIIGHDADHWMFVCTCYLVFWELSPFRKTDLYKALFTLMLPHRLDTLTFIGTGINPRNQKFIFICSLFGLLWLACGVRILDVTGRDFAASLAFNLGQAPWSDKVMAAVWSAAWLGAFYFMVHSFVQTSSAIGSEQLHYWRLKLTKRMRIPAIAAKSEKNVPEMLKTLPLFTHLSDDGLHRLATGSKLFWAEEGTPIVIEGEESHDLFVLFEGTVGIEKGQWRAPILPVTIFGESSLIEGKSPRNATVVALEKSLCLRVSVSLLRQIAHESNVIGEIESFMTAIMVDQFFSSSPLFRKLSREGIDFLSARGKLEFVGAGETIFQQGDPGDYFYMVIRGSVRGRINEANVKSIQQGGFFGEISLIANIPRTATIVAEEPSVLFKISIDAFWEVLVQHIEMALFIESIGEQRLIEDMQLMVRTG